MKDFIFFNYSHVPNSTYIFKSFERAGYSCDFIDNTNILDFFPKEKYKNVVLYLHEAWTLPITNNLIDNYFQDAIFIQHDDTDVEDVQTWWSNRKPDIIMQREYTDNTKNPNNSLIYPFHFPIPSMYDSSIEKTFDIVFMANTTNSRRVPFINHIKELSEGKLKHLRWNLQIDNKEETTHLYKKNINGAKIGLHYFGNSYDSWRIWELASSKTAIIMPKLIMKSVQKEFMPFNDYCIMEDNFQDLEEKIIFMLENDRYKEYADKAFNDYSLNHTPEKCFEYYHNKIKTVMRN